ncbi:hypothetical protein CLHOM_34000 [Clostridium homopropionicum DSM 5847]|uniref:DUF3189 family protein n=1 Tax=Clostridium homopropionicum DSM 5847 TaxID=1121318 RepID=A0A0L6Z6Q1_9CLOT|nr:DUF3189 family protein [Clostridium homopropionicum]KOA18498.1 hypothetical protein CLHOM_34000 [Clostridium homopropionicum DSM 5847]SFF65814.1 Protein of unknown function [Clostridium homopropionicum]
MIVIYHDVGGAHSTAVAANLHINKLPMDRVPNKDELLDLPTFDKIEKDQIGRLIYIGEDEYKIKVYTLARMYNPNLVVSVINDMYSSLLGNDKGLFIVDTKPTVNLLMNIGGYTSRKLHWVNFGRPIVTKGTQQAYMDIVNVVKNVKNNIKNYV